MSRKKLKNIFNTDIQYIVVSLLKALKIPRIFNHFQTIPQYIVVSLFTNHDE